MYRDEEGAVVAAGFEADAPSRPRPRRAAACDEAERLEREEESAVRSIAPDYASADFGRYLRVLDSTNPMHRLWSDSPWLKYRLARGCYWARCEFCDTGLDYVYGYAPADLDALFAAAAKASERTGLYGIHFVDEAMPMAGLLEFARRNRERGKSGKNPFHFWGNVRFDASWTPDRCEYLAASGLVAVSGGIEIATEKGLQMTDKGFDLAGLIRCLVAMRKSGLLVHAYLIYGFPGQDLASVADSAEVCRQLFASGLVDSAFWHRFVLTRHSRMYGEWLEGRRPELRPRDERRLFASNDLGFEGEEAYDEYDESLAAVLEAWMRGSAAAEGAGRSLEKAGLEGASRAAGIRPGLAESLISAAEAEEEDRSARAEGRARWIAGLPVLSSGLAWAYRGEIIRLDLPPDAARSLADAIRELAGDPKGADWIELRGRLGLPEAALGVLRSSGLVVV